MDRKTDGISPKIPLTDFPDSPHRESELRRLWKETFGDADEYISIVFDNYYSERFTPSLFSDGNAVAMMVGVPYLFEGVGGDMQPLPTQRGLYLCGLATDPRFRRHGLMSDLIEEANSRAREEGFDFTFLIPAGDDLREYYRKRGYVDAFFKQSHTFPNNYPFLKTYEKYTDENRKSKKINLEEIYHTFSFVIYTNENKNVYHQILKFLQNKSIKKYIYFLKHSINDWNAVFEENYISGGLIYFVQDAQKNISTVSFLFVHPDEERVEVRKIIATDSCSVAFLLESIKEKFPQYKIDLAIDAVRGAAGAVPLGMMRFLGKNENPFFENKRRVVKKNSIFKNDENQDFLIKLWQSVESYSDDRGVIDPELVSSEPENLDPEESKPDGPGTTEPELKDLKIIDLDQYLFSEEVRRSADQFGRSEFHKPEIDYQASLLLE